MPDDPTREKPPADDGVGSLSDTSVNGELENHVPESARISLVALGSEKAKQWK